MLTIASVDFNLVIRQTLISSEHLNKDNNGHFVRIADIGRVFRKTYYRIGLVNLISIGTTASPKLAKIAK